MAELLAANQITIAKVLDGEKGADGEMSAEQLAQLNQASEDASTAKTDVANLEIGGRNLILKSETRPLSKFKDTITTQTDITVSEWGTNKAIRSYGVCSSSTIFGVLATGSSSPRAASGQAYVYSIYVKNNGETAIRINNNNLGDSLTIQSGESTRVILHGTGDGTHYLQFVFFSSNLGDAFDVTYWHPKIEIGDKATDWTPAPEDVDSSINDAAKVATNFIGYDGTNGLVIGNKTSGSWSGYRSQILPGSFNVLDASSTVLASFGPTTVIGEEAKANMHLTFNNLSMIDKEGSAFFEVGDNRDASGVATLKYTGKNQTIIDGATDTPIIEVDLYVNIESIISVFVDSVEINKSNYSIYASHMVEIRNVTSGVRNVEINFTTASLSSYLTFGTREPSSSIGTCSSSEGVNLTAAGFASHAEGDSTRANGYTSHAEGSSTIASEQYSHAEGHLTNATGESAHAEGSRTTASGNYSHAEGSNTTASGRYSHAGGSGTTASGLYSHAEGCSTIADGESAHAEGYNTTASGNYSHAEGRSTIASEQYAHAEGVSTTASGQYSHAEGFYTKASNSSSHAEGNSTTASGIHSHAEGNSTTASGLYSHAGGRGTIADGETMTAIGAYNTEDSGKAFVIGNGTSDTDRSDAFAVDWDGNTVMKGGLTLGTALSIANGGTGATTAAAACTNLGIKDYVIENGTTSGWTYRKWASGKVQAWYNLSVTGTIATASGNIYISDATPSTQVPASVMSSADNVQARITSPGSYMCWLASCSDRKPSSRQVGQFYLCRGSKDSTSRTRTIEFYVEGKA